MKTVLFIFAHLDDETILSYGTLLKFIDLGMNCHVCCMCGNGRDGSQAARQDAFVKNMRNANATCSTYSNYDLQLTSNSIKTIISDEIDKHQPHTIITHSMHDLHFEHRLIAEQVLLCCRLVPGTNTRRLWTTTSPTEKWTYGQFGCFQPNVFIDISMFIDDKKKALLNYDMELPSFPDNRSIDSIINRNQEDGYRIGVSYAESYEQLFEVL